MRSLLIIPMNTDNGALMKTNTQIDKYKNEA